MKLPFKFAMAVLLMASASLASAQNLQTIYSFTNRLGPRRLTLGSDGNFYGTTAYGGITNSTYAQGMGMIFRVTTNGTFTTLVSFSGNAPYAGVQGAYSSELALGNDGNFYGTTYEGGAYGDGSIFNVSTNGTLTTLVSFSASDATKAYGVFPQAPLTLGNDGSFYGTTGFGGNIYNVDDGTVFRVTTSGGLTPLASFSGTNGLQPQSALTLGSDGNLYGTTYDGGITYSSSIAGKGAVFRLIQNGSLAALYSFTNGMGGANPEAALTLGRDGNFYGTTYYGGSAGYGTVFQVTTNGTLTTLASFNYTNGFYPAVGLTQGNDGNFYGITSYGGSGGGGTIFQITTNGTLTTLFSFSGTNGANPHAALTLGNDGNFYGTTLVGGNTNALYPEGMGTVFCLLLTPVFFIQPQSQTNNAGATVTFLCGTILQPIGYQWQRDGTNLANGGNISGATSSTLTIFGISDSDVASYSVIASNAQSSVSSSRAILTVIDPPSIATEPTNLLVLAGTNASFGVSLTGSLPFFYQWQFDSANLINATNAIYTIPSVRTNNAGNYSVEISNPAGSVTSSNATLTIVLSPSSRTNYASSTATLTATAIGPDSLNYQWQKNGVALTNGGNISGATNSTLIIANLSDADAANYAAVVTDGYREVTTSNAELMVNDSLVFVTQPLSQTVGAGSMVTFTATVYGAPPFVFRWFFNQTSVGSPITGTNSSSYILTNVRTNQTGIYTVEVFNGSGSLTSSNAVLIVIPPPALTLQILAGYPVLNLRGMLGYNFLVQYSANVAGTNWINLLSLTNLSISPYQFLDASGVRESARFYRAFFTQ